MPDTRSGCKGFAGFLILEARDHRDGQQDIHPVRETGIAPLSITCLNVLFLQRPIFDVCLSCYGAMRLTTAVLLGLSLALLTSLHRSMTVLGSHQIGVGYTELGPPQACQSGRLWRHNSGRLYLGKLILRASQSNPSCWSLSLSAKDAK